MIARPYTGDVSHSSKLTLYGGRAEASSERRPIPYFGSSVAPERRCIALYLRVR
jgi:hypothetical protein